MFKVKSVTYIRDRNETEYIGYTLMHTRVCQDIFIMFMIVYK